MNDIVPVKMTLEIGITVPSILATAEALGIPGIDEYREYAVEMLAVYFNGIIRGKFTAEMPKEWGTGVLIESIKVDSDALYNILCDSLDKSETQE